jgi:cytochrome o ubiquinol oxidase subunit 3
MSQVNVATLARVRRQEEKRLSDERTLFGFWIYIMTDCVLFASLFAKKHVWWSRRFSAV